MLISGTYLILKEIDSENFISSFYSLFGSRYFEDIGHEKLRWLLCYEYDEQATSLVDAIWCYWNSSLDLYEIRMEWDCAIY